MEMRASIKNGFLRALEMVQAHKLSAAYRRDRLLVVCYHGVTADSRPATAGYRYDTVSAREFAHQLEILSEWYRFVSLGGAMEWIEHGPCGGAPPVLVTFDDGYRNNLTVAAPALKKLGVPAVFFLTTGYVGAERILWPTEMGERIEQSAGASIPLPGREEQARVPADGAARAVLGARLRSLCKQLPNRQRLEYLEQLRRATELDPARVDRETHGFLSWDEARQLVAMGFDVGSHTIEHPILSRLDADELRAELCGSRAKLEREIQGPVTTLAYPNGGVDDFNEVVMAEARQAGYRHAFAVGDAFHDRRGSSMAIRRMIVPGQAPDSLFYFIASGWRDICLRK